jgi:hypothetical protein
MTPIGDHLSGKGRALRARPSFVFMLAPPPGFGLCAKPWVS